MSKNKVKATCEMVCHDGINYLVDKVTFYRDSDTFSLTIPSWGITDSMDILMKQFECSKYHIRLALRDGIKEEQRKRKNNG